MSDRGWVALGYLLGVVTICCCLPSLFVNPLDVAVVASFHLTIRY